MTVIEIKLGIQESIHVDAPPDRVWSVFSRLDRWPEWDPVYRQPAWVSGHSWAVGSTFQFTIKPWWAAATVKSEVVEVLVGEKLIWVGRRAGIWGQHTFRIEPEGDGARAVTHEVFGGPMSWLLALVAPSWRVRGMLVRWLEAIKAEAEKGD